MKTKEGNLRDKENHRLKYTLDILSPICVLHFERRFFRNSKLRRICYLRHISVKLLNILLVNFSSSLYRILGTFAAVLAFPAFYRLTVLAKRIGWSLVPTAPVSPRGWPFSLVYIPAPGGTKFSPRFRFLKWRGEECLPPYGLGVSLVPKSRTRRGGQHLRG